MKPLARFAFGTGGGALLALLYHTMAADRPLSATADSFFDLAVGGPDPVVSERVGVRTPSATIAAADRLPAADGIPAEFRASFASVDDWAFFDPAGFFAHAEAATSIDQLIEGLEVLIATDPARVMEIAARFQGKGSRDIDELYLHAIKGMVGRDRYAAVIRLQGVAAGPQRDPILAAISEAYASIDADAALQWAASLVPPAPGALDGVLETVAATDLLRAYELMQQLPGRIANAEVLASRWRAPRLPASRRPRRWPATWSRAMDPMRTSY
jgi:hypothetical protein